MIEVISIPGLLDKPRYLGGLYLSTRLHWKRQEDVALAALCREAAPIEASAAGLGRSPSSIAHRASDTGLKLPREWRQLISKKRERAAPSRPLLQYPYIAAVRGEHADLVAVHATLPSSLPSYERADICQEMMLAIWEGRHSVDEFRNDPALVRSFIKHYRSENMEMGGYAISLDKPLKNGGSWYDILPDPTTTDFN